MSDPFPKAVIGFEKFKKDKPVVKEIERGARREVERREREYVKPRTVVDENVDIKHPTDLVEVTYETSEGESKTINVKAMHYESHRDQIENRGGTIYSIQYKDRPIYKTESPSDYKSRIDTYYTERTERQESYEQRLEKYSSDDKRIIKTLSPQMLWLVHNSPKGEQIQNQYINLYRDASSEQQFNNQVERMFASNFHRLGAEKQIRFYKKFGKFDDPATDEIESLSWTEMEQKGYKFRRNKSVVTGDTTSFDIVKKKQPDTGTPLGKAVSWIFMPIGEHYQIIKEQFTGMPRPGVYDIARSHEAVGEGIRRSEKFYTDLWKSGDVPGLAGRVISSGPVAIGTSYFGGRLFGSFVRSSIGMKEVAKIGSRVVTPGRILGAGVTSGFAAGVGYGGYSAFKQGNIKDFVGVTALTSFFVIPSFRYGYKKSVFGPLRKPFFKKEVLIKMDKFGTVEAVGGQKYFEMFGKKIVYGKKFVGLPRQGTQSFASNIHSSQLVPYQPSGLARYQAIRFGYLPEMFGKTQVRTIRNVRVFQPGYLDKPQKIVTFKGLPYKEYIPRPTKLSNLVYPKPKLFRSYEVYWRYIVYNKPWVSVKKTPIIQIKPFKPFHKTLRDVIPPDRPITKGDQVQRGGTVTVQKTIQETKKGVKTEKLVVPVQLLKPVTRFGYLQEVKLESQFKGLGSVYGQSYKSMQKQSRALLSVSGLLSKQVKVVDSDKALARIQKKLSAQDSLQRLDQRQRFDSIRIVSPMLSFDTLLDIDYITKLKYPEFKPRFRVPPTPQIPKVNLKKIRMKKYAKLPEDESGGERVDVESQQGYNVLVKDRYIVHGKKRYEERFVKLNKNVLNKHDALSFGGTVVDNSAAASFKIVPTSGKPSKPSINVNPWSFIQNIFYKRDKIFIERTQHRISTPGEVREISARGWVAEKRKLSPRPKKILKKNNLKVLKMKDVRDMLKVRII